MKLVSVLQGWRVKMISLLIKNLVVMLLKKLIDKWLFPELQKLAESSENKIDDILIDAEVVENAKKMIHLGIDKVKEKL